MKYTVSFETVNLEKYTYTVMEATDNKDALFQALDSFAMFNSISDIRKYSIKKG